MLSPSPRAACSFIPFVAPALLCAAALAQVTSPALPNTPAHPGWSTSQSPAALASGRPLPHAMEQLRRDAGLIASSIKHPEARRLLLGTSWLPVMDPVLLYTSETGLSADEQTYQALSPSLRSGLPWRAALHNSYAIYYPRTLSPIWSVRAADIALEALAPALVARAESKSPARASPQPDEAALATLDKPLRGQHLLLVQSDSFVLASLLAGQGAHVTVALVGLSPLASALQTSPQWQGNIRGAGMGEAVAPDGTLRIVALPLSQPRAWASSPELADALTQQVQELGSFDAVLVIEFDQAATPHALPTQLGTLAAMHATRESAAPKPATPLFAPSAPIVWYAVASTKEHAGTIEALLTRSEQASQQASQQTSQLASPQASALDDTKAMQAIASSLAWNAGDNPINPDDVRAWWWQGQTP
jgi:hypothetical protein